MKKLLLHFCLFISFATCAQVREGVITYEQVLNISKSIPEEVRQYVPGEKTSRHKLYFDSTQSLYITEPESPTGSVMFMGSDRVYYMNKAKNKRVTATTVGDDEYRMVDTLKKIDWTITEETKTILGYTCKKAVTKKMAPRSMVQVITTSTPISSFEAPELVETTIIAWYTDKIPFSGGPDSYFGLPGIILEMDINDGEKQITALDISTGANGSTLAEPKKGKIVTSDELNKVLADKTRQLMPGY